MCLKDIPFKKTNLQNSIYKNIFLDKKRLDKCPRYISVKNFHNTNVKEIQDFDLLNDAITQIINDK